MMIWIVYYNSVMTSLDVPHNTVQPTLFALTANNISDKNNPF